MTRRLCIRQCLTVAEHLRDDAVLLGLFYVAHEHDIWSREFKLMNTIWRAIVIKALNERTETGTWIKRALGRQWWCDKGSIHRVADVIEDALLEMRLAFDERYYKGILSYACNLRSALITGSTITQICDAIKNGYPIMAHETNDYQFMCSERRRTAHRRGFIYLPPVPRNLRNWMRIGNYRGNVEMGVFSIIGLPVSGSTDELIPLYPPENAGFIWAFVLAKMFRLTCRKGRPLGRVVLSHNCCFFRDIPSKETKKIADIVRDAMLEADRCYDQGCLSVREQFARQCFNHNSVARVAYYTDSLGPRISPRPGPDGKDMYVCVCDNCKANLAKKRVVRTPVITIVRPAMKRRRVECS
jgi:hypothetical protein